MNLRTGMLAADEDALVALESGDVLLEADLAIGKGILEDGLLLNGDRQRVSGKGKAIALGQNNCSATIEVREVFKGFDRSDLSDFCVQCKLPFLYLSDIRNRDDFTVILIFK